MQNRPNKKSKRGNTAEIVIVGNELLIGHTLDTNSNWVAQRLTENGWRLERITTIPDDLNEIGKTVRGIMLRKPDLLLTMGGLGPTPDDMTLRGVAGGLGRKLGLNKEALGMIREFYSRMGRGGVQMTLARRKMALLPLGARPLKNPVGTAPGVLSVKGRTMIASLPGVPREMQAIFTDSIVPILKKSGGQGPAETVLGIDGMVESALAPAIVKLRRVFPNLYFKSHPRGSETSRNTLIELHIYSLDEKGRKLLAKAASMIVQELFRISKTREKIPD